jgi:multisubunit Na+/H+ antiporter MnhC subunit
MSSFYSTSYIKKGLLYGLLGTLIMSLIMLTGMGTGISPIPEPIPLAIASGLLGNAAQPLLMLFAVITHFGYGAFWGAVLFRIYKTTGTLWHGLAWGAMLWVIMQVMVLPLLGWGIFGIAVTPKIAVVTLILHLVYGSILGWGLNRIRK